MEARRRFVQDPASSQDARIFVHDIVAPLDDDELVEVATLLVSELVANAVTHGDSGGEVVIEITDTAVRVTVTDTSPRQPIVRPVEPTSSTGRGVWLVDRLAAHWGVRRSTQEGKAVWFELDRVAGG